LSPSFYHKSGEKSVDIYFDLPFIYWLFGVSQSTLNKYIKEERIMKSYVCTICGYVYDEKAGDPDNGVAPETKWADVPNDWICPLCGASKEDFEEQ
jgi:rubredoxin